MTIRTNIRMLVGALMVLGIVFWGSGYYDADSENRLDALFLHQENKHHDIVRDNEHFSPSMSFYTPLKQTFVDPFIQHNGGQNRFVQEDSSVYGVRTTENIEYSNSIVFRRLWPDFYISYLHSIEQLMRKDGFLASSSTISFSSDHDIYMFLSQIVQYAETKGFITGEDAVNFQSGIQTILPSLIEKEREQLRRELFGAFPFQQKYAQNALFHHSPSSDGSLVAVMVHLRTVLGLGTDAHAQFGFGGLLGGGCYKDNAPLFLVPGVNLWAPCCDCEVDGTPIGCLNAVCAAWPNAIWDPLTGICGCG